MVGVNKVILVGNLGKDPDVRTLEKGAKKASFSLATSEFYKDQEGQKVEHTEWHNIVLWNRLAEIAESYLKKGQTIYLEGSIRTRTWNDEHGNKHYVTEIVGEKLKMFGSKRDEKTNLSEKTSETLQTIVEPVAEDPINDDLPF